MSHTLTETATFDASIVVPDDGDALAAASVVSPLQKVTNRTKHLTFNGRIDWNGEISNAPGSANVVVGPIPYLSLGGVLLSASSNTTVPTSGLAADTWYYLYAYNDSGTLAIEYSTTAPDASRVFKTGGTTHRYLGLFRSNGSSAILPFLAHRGEYVYRISGLAAANWRVFDAGNPGAGIALDCSPWKPDYAKHVLLDAIVANSGANATLASFASTSTDTGLKRSINSADGSDTHGQVDIATPDHQVYLTAVVAGGTPVITVYVAGFKE